MNDRTIFRGDSQRPVFVGGLMISGTSLMRVLLGQHPSLFASFESHWFVDEVRFGWHDPTSQRMRYLLSFFDLGETEYEDLCHQKKADPEREFIDLVMSFYAQRAGKPRWVEKTPDNIRHWSLIKKQWPDATLIHMTREYKDTFASWKINKGKEIDAFLTSALGAYGDILELLGSKTENYIEVDYNDLVTNPKSTVKQVLNHIGEEWSPECTQLDLTATEGERGTVRRILGRESHTAVSLTKPIFPDSIGQWRHLITEDEQRRIEKELSRFYDIFGDKWCVPA